LLAGAPTPTTAPPPTAPGPDLGGGLGNAVDGGNFNLHAHNGGSPTPPVSGYTYPPSPPVVLLSPPGGWPDDPDVGDSGESDGGTANSTTAAPAASPWGHFMPGASTKVPPSESPTYTGEVPTTPGGYVPFTPGASIPSGFDPNAPAIGGGGLMGMDIPVPVPVAPAEHIQEPLPPDDTLLDELETGDYGDSFAVQPVDAPSAAAAAAGAATLGGGLPPFTPGQAFGAGGGGGAPSGGLEAAPLLNDFGATGSQPEAAEQARGGGASADSSAAARATSRAATTSMSVPQRQEQSVPVRPERGRERQRERERQCCVSRVPSLLAHPLPQERQEQLDMRMLSAALSDGVGGEPDGRQRGAAGAWAGMAVRQAVFHVG
jgi:hypothetical protein